MELPARTRGDVLLPPGEMTRLRLRLQNMAARHDLTTVIACAFDHRTRMLPLLYADLKMAPAGVRAIGSALVDVGFPKTRIVLQQWNSQFRPSLMRLDSRMPDLFLVSSTRLHSAQCDALIRDACRIDPARRPLIVAGGPKAIYEPWTLFGSDPGDPWAADVVVTGEEHVFLSLLEVLLSVRAHGESMRSAFQRARDSGALDAVPGLVYARTDARGVPRELIDTGIQRLLGDLDELPHPVLGYRLLEPPSDRDTLAPEAIPPARVRKHSRMASLVLTQGCRFHCSFCPIPAYNQGQCRVKSGLRIADEIARISFEYDIKAFFGADDNFFVDRDRAIEIVETLARQVDGGSRPHCKARWFTEATIHDTLKMKDHLRLMRKAGLWGLWLGVEDMSGALVRKGQGDNRTLEAFRVLRENGILPIPMLMHHDSQPLYTRHNGRGLLNQVGVLRRAGAVYATVLMLTPAPGSKSYEEAYTSGLAYRSCGGMAVEPRMSGGLYVTASRHPRPWHMQFNLLAAYAWFFNPVRFLAALARSKSRIPLADTPTWPPPDAEGRRPPEKRSRRLARTLGVHLFDAYLQLFGMWGLAVTLRRTLGWTIRLMGGRIERYTAVPVSPIPMRSPDGGPASHALPGTPLAVPSPGTPPLPSGIAR